MNLEQIIDQWIGEENKLGEDKSLAILGYNQALQDLKSRKQELVEGIEKWATEKYIAQRLKELTDKFDNK